MSSDSLSRFAVALQSLLDAARNYPQTHRSEDDLAHIQSLFAGVQLSAPPNFFIPPFQRGVWRINRVGYDQASTDGGETWKPSPYFNMLQMGNWEACNRWISEIQGILDAVYRQIESQGTAVEINSVWKEKSERTSAEEKKLSRTEEAVLSIIKSQPKGNGISGKAIIKSLQDMGVELAESTLRKHILPKLAKYGVVNHRSAGGYLIP